jgi:hypothetical protein
MVRQAQLAQAQALIAAGHANQATRRLQQIDTRYGGLAAPTSIQLLQAIDAQHASSKRANIKP